MWNGLNQEIIVYRYLVRSFQEKYSFGSLGSLWNLLEKAGWKTVIRVVRPLLTEKHKEERIKWCEEHKVPSTTEDHVTVHVDEKWFFFAKKRQRLHVPPGINPEPLHVIHKCHIPKVMVLAAIAKPSPTHNFNGCLGCWPVTEEKIAKRNSKNRPKGTVEDVPTTLNGKLFIEMMKDNLGNEIIQKLSWAKEVTVQIDGAGGHSIKKSVNELNNWGKNQVPKITVVVQPARSPDLNALDLGAWTSLQATVDDYKDESLREQYYEGRSETILQKIITEAFIQWANVDKLSKIFNTLQKQYQLVIDAKGDVVNPVHTKKTKK